MRWGRAACAALLWLSGAWGCSQDAASSRSQALDPEAAGVVVARVNGEAIMRAQVERLCEVSGFSPTQALERLVSEA